MNEGLTINNFFNHHIIRPLEAPKVDRLKAVISSIAVGILTCGLVHLSVFIKQICIKKIELLNSLQKRVSQFNPSKADIIKSNNEVEKFLNEKKNNYKKQPEIQQKIHTKKAELKDLRKNSPQNYPSYFDDLLDHGYIYTCDHLIQMQNIPDRNNRKKAIEKMSFSEVSHIVLEIREYFIHILKNSIPKNANKILFLLGPTGAGKSTALCFLRGDEMVARGLSYESKNDKEGLIGHKLANSCTFLPTIEVIDNLTIVDFPGFDDSNGSIITLGIEIALKALINQYNPGILILEPITDIESKYANAAKIGFRLKRLLNNPDLCVLGITKYSQNIYYQKLKEIEEHEKQSSPEELKLIARIELITEDIQDETDPQKILKLEQNKTEYRIKLKNKIDERIKNNQSETPEKTIYRQNIQEVETELSHQVGLTKILKLLDFEDKDYQKTCLEILSTLVQDKPKLNKRLNLDASEREVLDTIFNYNLRKELNSHLPQQKNINSIESFYKSVAEHSLIYTIAPQEIAKFLHLPEMDPNVVIQYDSLIMDECIQKYMRAAIGGLHLSVLEKILDKAENSKKVEEIRNQIKNYKKFIQGLLGVKPTDDQKKAEEQWKRIEEQHQIALETVEQKFKLPTWAIVALSIPVIPITIYTIWQKYNIKSEQKQIMMELTDQNLDKFSSELKHIQQTLTSLKKLEFIIENKRYKNNCNSNI